VRDLSGQILLFFSPYTLASRGLPSMQWQREVLGWLRTKLAMLHAENADFAPTQTGLIRNLLKVKERLSAFLKS
jgi:hypothetical protein